jgi:hypothetical protein
MKANLGYVQGYNAQAVVDEGQLVIAAEITNTPGDFSNLDPMLTTALGELERVGVTERPEVALADAGYWNEQHFDEVIANKHIQVLIPPDRGGRSQPRPGWTGGRYSWMRAVLASEHGKTALPQANPDDRARVRAHQAQPADHPISPKRQDRGADRMAAADGNPQPHQAPPPPTRHRRNLNRWARRLPPSPVLDDDYVSVDRHLGLGVSRQPRDQAQLRDATVLAVGEQADAWTGDRPAPPFAALGALSPSRLLPPWATCAHPDCTAGPGGSPRRNQRWCMRCSPRLMRLPSTSDDPSPTETPASPSVPSSERWHLRQVVPLTIACRAKRSSGSPTC